jgi:predicted cupin superfamily sugar epimerase
MKESPEYWIRNLNLKQHPEGGFFSETYRSDETFDGNVFSEKFTGQRSLSTAIYFLLKGNQISQFHRLKSDELWHFYYASSLTVHTIDQAGTYFTICLGSDHEKGEVFQTVIKKGIWLGATVNNIESFSLVGCTLSPGFDFKDFELADQKNMLEKYPQHELIIKKLTNANPSIAF